MILLFTQRTLQTRDKEIAKLYIDGNIASELHFQTRMFDIFDGLKIINSNFGSSSHHLTKSTLRVEYKNAKHFPKKFGKEFISIFIVCTVIYIT